MINLPEIIDLLKKIPVFKHLEQYELSTLVKHADIVHFHHNQLVVREGEIGRAFFVIISGVVEVFTLLKDGRELQLATLRQHDYFGEQSLLPGGLGKRNASVRVIEDATLLKVLGRDFQKVLYHDPRLLGELRIIEQEHIRQRMVQESALLRTLPLDDSSQQHWLEQQTFRDGEIVFREGDVGDKFYLVLAGVAKATKTIDGEEKLLGRMQQGSFFGELALINKAPRAATITAEGTLRVAALSGDKFLSLYENSPALQEQMERLSGFYHLPKTGGVFTLHAGKFMDMNSFTSVYHSPSRINVTAHKVVNKPIVNIQRIKQPGIPTTHLVYRTEDDTIYRELVLQKARIVSVMVTGEWQDLGRVYELVINNTRIWTWQCDCFCKTGELWLERERKNYSEQAVICRCTGLTRHDLNHEIVAGCNSLESLAQKTGVSRVCGACVPQLIEMVGHSDRQTCEVIEIIPVNSTVKSFRFKPSEGQLVPATLPGQHIYLEVHTRWHWIERAYILTSPLQQRDYYEITVRHEPHGLMSDWLHTQLKVGAFVRVSEPQGESYKSATATTPIVFFAAGIGITPALSLLRARVQHPNPAPLYVDYSVGSSDELIYAEELRNYHYRNPYLTVNIRTTDQQSYLSREEVNTIMRTHPQAEVFICGPATYQNAVTNHLATAGVPLLRIHSEEFAPLNKIDHLDDAPLQFASGLLFSAILTLGILLVSLVSNYLLLDSNQPALFDLPFDKGDWKSGSGYILLILLIMTSLVLPRKRWYIGGWWHYDSWRLAHTIIGVFVLIILLLHTKLAWGTQLVSSLLNLDLFGVIIVGALTALLTVFADESDGWLERIRSSLNKIHAILLIPLPILLIWHIVSVS